jgi:hypothetical protein
VVITSFIAAKEAAARQPPSPIRSNRGRPAEPESPLESNLLLRHPANKALVVPHNNLLLMTSMTVSDEIRHPIEAQSSWRTHLERVRALEEDGNGMELDESHRSLRKDDDDDDALLWRPLARKRS